MKDLDLVGETFEAVVPIERYPHFTLPTGTVVTVKEVREDIVWAEVSEYHSELDEWDNCVSWHIDERPGVDDVRLYFLGEVRPYNEDTPDPFPLVAARKVLKFDTRAEGINSLAFRAGVLAMVAYMMGYGPDEIDRAEEALD